MESTAKYIVPVVGGPMDGAVLYLQIPPEPKLIVPRFHRDLEPGEFVLPNDPRILKPHKYLLQPSPARYIYEHLACS